MRRSLIVELPQATYRPIADYGAIGQGHSVALVARDGNLDWWCPGRFDSPSVFGALLDANVGGSYKLGPTATGALSVQRYIDDTNVLETIHTTAAGVARVVDFAPYHDDLGVDNDVIIRRVTGLRGTVEFGLRFEPRFQYGRISPRYSRTPAGLIARGAGEVLLLSGATEPNQRWFVGEGETLDLTLRHRALDTPTPFSRELAYSPAELERRTIQRWVEWSARTNARGRYAPAIRRAALALKLLQSAKTGAIVAAPTTSIPEEIGGVRNWDYRYAWLRDAALSARALATLGHLTEAEAFSSWLVRTIRRDGDDFRIMYTVTGSSELDEHELRHLQGYRKSAPVRIGNGAATQRQLDVYGEIFDYVHEFQTHWSPEDWAAFRSLADWVCDHWAEPDSGIWEMRCEPRHFVLSKAMAWAALERASDLAKTRGLDGDVARWDREAERIRADVLEKGYDHERNAFVQAYGVPFLDASNLLLPLIGFVDANDPRMIATVDRTLERLTMNGLVYRYIGAGDGIAGGEATFAYCTFWLVEVLAKQGRRAEARKLFEGIMARATPLGLFAEEIDAATGEHLGNYPQAFPHAGLIAAALALDEGDDESDN